MSSEKIVCKCGYETYSPQGYAAHRRRSAIHNPKAKESKHAGKGESKGARGEKRRTRRGVGGGGGGGGLTVEEAIAALIVKRDAETEVIEYLQAMLGVRMQGEGAGMSRKGRGK